jgi:mono/diheme cytochrome c family protein
MERIRIWRQTPPGATNLNATRILRAIPFLLLLTAAFSASGFAQQSGAMNSLTDTQKLGQRIFQQRCAVCHTPPTYGSKVYGPVLYKDLIEGNEDTIRDFIMSGSKGLMPGFKYGLEPAEIKAVIEFLKTLPRPAPPKSGRSNDSGPVD